MRRREANLGAVVLTLIAAAVTVLAVPRERTAAVQRPESRFNLGVLRADGILLPFASFDGDDWRASWPADLTGRDLPATLNAIPRDWWGGAEPAGWRVVPAEGGAPRTIKVISPVMIGIGAERRIALRTDHPAGPIKVSPFDVAFPKVGLAIAGDVDLQPITTADPGTPESRQFLQPIRSALNAAEEQTIGALRANTGWSHPYDRKLRTRLEPVFEARYSTIVPDGGVRVSYVEVAKKYPPGPKDEGCGLETFITGWVFQTDRPERPKADLRAAVVYCDRERVSYMLPFGQIVLGNRTYWVCQMSGFDHEWYLVAEVTRSRVRTVAEYLAGGMPQPVRPPG